jgi:hypothetical protein
MKRLTSEVLHESQCEKVRVTRDVRRRMGRPKPGEGGRETKARFLYIAIAKNGVVRDVFWSQSQMGQKLPHPLGIV